MNNQEHPGGQDVIKARRFFAFLGLIFVGLGQIYLFAFPAHDKTVLPPYSWLSIIGVIILISSQMFRPARFVQVIFSKLPVSGSLTWILAAITLSGLATWGTFIFSRLGRTNYIPVVTLWVAGWVCYLAAFSKPFFDAAKLRDWFKTHRNEILLVAAVMLFGFALRFYKLGLLPRVMDGDEGRLGLAAQSTLASDLSNPFALWENFGGIYLQGVNVLISLFGATPLALRLLPAVSGTLAILAIYLLSRSLTGPRVALITAILLTISHTHIHFSRIAAVGYIHATWLVPLELYFFFSGVNKRSSWRAAVGGILLAIHYTIYLTSQVITGLVLVYALLALVFFRAWIRPALRQVFAFFGGFLVAASPELLYITFHPEQFTDRLAQNGTFQTGWLANTMALTGQSAVVVLGQRVLHAFLSLIYYPAIDFYGSSVPMLTFLSASLFLIGLGLILWKTNSPKFMLLNGYFWAPTLAIGIFAIPPSADSYRMLAALPAAMMVVAIATDYLLDTFGLGWAANRPAYLLSTGFILTSLLAFNLWTYYGDFVGHCRYGDNLPSRYASYLGSYVRTIKSENTIYMLSSPEYFYGSHDSVDFLTGYRQIINVHRPVSELQAVSGEIIIANPDRIDELADWARTQPGGELHFEYDCNMPILLSYRLP